MPSKLTDEEIRARLEAHNYNVPAITDTTRSVLVKKLRQLDQQAAKSRTAAPSIDYSSAEEDFVPATTSTRKNVGSTLKSRTRGYSGRNGTNTATSYKDCAPVYKSALQSTNYATRTTSARTNNNNNGFSLVNQSDDDEEDEDEDEESDEVDEDSDEKLDEYEEEITSISRADLGIQTSFNSSGGGEMMTPETETRFRGKTLVASPSTSGGGMISSPTTSPLSSTPPSSSSPYTIRSPHLRQNIGKFGSLNEALATLPTNKSTVGGGGTSAAGTPTSRNQSLVHQASPPVGQMTRSNLVPYKQSYSSSSTRNVGNTSSNSILAPSVIGTCALLFFMYLGYRYMTLSPSLPTDRYPLCTGSPTEKPNLECIPGPQFNRTAKLLEALLTMLKQDQNCPRTDSQDSLMLEDLRAKLETDMPDFAQLIQNVLILLKQNPSWGIKPIYEEGKITAVSAVDSRSGIYCTIMGFIYLLVELICQAANYIISISIILAISWLTWRAWKYWREKKQLEEQEMFELVERVLIMLQENHAEKEGTNGPSFLAIVHVRDQLISPQDRSRKKGVWESVKRYISRNESRVREDVKQIHGEEFLVWQWLPDLPGGASPNGGSSPIRVYAGRVHTPSYSRAAPRPTSQTPMSMGHRSPTASSSGYSTLAGKCGGSPNSEHYLASNKKDPWPYAPTTTAGSPLWQGQAFQLNRNVSAPDQPPTNCIKARSMFNPQLLSPEWLKGIKSDIVSRCSDAKILHIAVDKESKEGIVYIKAATAEDAGKVFNNIHGQWYKNQLVSAKYLREDRYHQRFPDSINAHLAMQP